MFWNPNHPERDELELRALSWKQAAELATCEPQQAAALLIAYETAPDVNSASRAALDLEAARAEVFAQVHRAAFLQEVQANA